MKNGITVVSNLDGVDKMLKKRGLEPNGKVQQVLAHEVARNCDPYVPMQEGILKNTRIVENDGVIYQGPYARYQYHGKLMIGRAPKKLTDKDLTYHGAPQRGPFWDKRMWKDKGNGIVDRIAKAAGGIPSK